TNDGPPFTVRTARHRHWKVVVEKPTYDRTVFKVLCGRLTLKVYTQGERVLRLEALVHNIGRPGLRSRSEPLPPQRGASWQDTGTVRGGSFLGGRLLNQRRNPGSIAALGLGGPEPRRGNRFEPDSDAGRGRLRHGSGRSASGL